MSLQDDELPWPDDAVEVARIADAWGIKGWIRVEPYAKDPKALFSSRRWFLQPPPGSRPTVSAPAVPRLLRITQAKEHGDGVVACARELSDRASAEALKGTRVFVSRASFPTAAADEYYWVDLIGLDVVNRRGERLGTVTDLLDTGAHCVLRIQPPPVASPALPPADASQEIPSATEGASAGSPASPKPANRSRRRAGKPAGSAADSVAPAAERLVPFVAAYVDAVSLDERCIRVDWELDY